MNPGITSLGNPKAALRLYLPTPPLLENGWCGYDDAVRQNGNHWRKILIILSKIASPTDDWRHHRDNNLFSAEAIDFGDRLNTGCTYPPDRRKSQLGKAGAGDS